LIALKVIFTMAVNYSEFIDSPNE